VERVLDDEANAAVDAVVRVEIELGQRLGSGHWVVAVVEPDGQEVLADHDLLRDVETEGEPAPQVATEDVSIEPHVGHVHRAVEAQEHLPARGLPADGEPLPVPAGALPLPGVAARLPSQGFDRAVCGSVAALQARSSNDVVRRPRTDESPAGG
jgi:hypothetical protein